MPQFSVLMPVYNRETLVARAIESVVEQTCGDWELVIVDDGSTDATPLVLADFARRDPRIRVIRQPNGGAASARERAAGEARGEWFTCLESDDLWLHDALEHFATYAAAHPAARFLYGYHHRLRGEQAEYLRGRMQDRPTDVHDVFASVFLNPICVCHRRELRDLVGGYDTTLRFCDDYDLYLRMSLHCAFEPVNRPIGLRRRHEGNLSVQSGRSQQGEAFVLRRFVEERGGRDVLTVDEINRRLGRVYFRAAKCYFRERNFAAARAMADEARSYRTSWRNEAIRLLSHQLAPRVAA